MTKLLSALAPQVDAMLAAVHALCCCLRLGSAQGEFPEPEDAVPLLLRVLQVR